MEDNEVPFEEFASIKRLRRGCVVTEKIDGTNAQIYIDVERNFVLAGSRSRWITPDADNYGFARWVADHRDELFAGLGVGRHYGEWWGQGIQRRYGMDRKVFSLFNAGRWNEDNPAPACCSVVPVLYTGDFDTAEIDRVLAELRDNGSAAAPGFMNPEGIVVFHTQSRTLYKKTLDKNDGHKSLAIAEASNG